jgi:NADH:ubiquinone oxidoreductase subunit E
VVDRSTEMSANAGTRITRAQAEGVFYQLPEGEQSEVFEKRVRPLLGERDTLLEVLHIAQESYGYLPELALGWIAQEFKIPKKEVFEAATFYSMFSLKPEAKYVISACDCLSCYLNDGEAVLEALRKAANIPNGETSSEDGLFSLRVVPCLGLCDLAPAIMINQDRYVLLTPEKAHHIISELRNKETVKEGQHD